MACSSLLVVVLWILTNYSHISSGIAYFWCGVAVVIPLVFTAKTIYRLVATVSRQPVDPSLAKVCSVEVCIDNDTVLTVKSWWSMEMDNAEVERHGVRIAMGSAKRWISDNSHHGGKMSSIQFTESDAVEICNKYISKSSCCSQHGHQCAVCLDAIDSGSQPGIQMNVCGHVFHQKCISTWFAQSSKLMCPMCRTDHHGLVPSGELKKYVVNQDPSVTVLAVSIETGSLPLENL